MAKISASPEELSSLSNQMTKWSVDLKELNSKLKNLIRFMDGWRDPQHAMFLQSVEMTSRQVESYARTMETMGTSLKTYSNKLKDFSSAFRSNMSSIR